MSSRVPESPSTRASAPASGAWSGTQPLAAAPAPAPASMTRAGLALNLVGVVVVAYWAVVGQGAAPRPVVIGLAAVALAAWAVRSVLAATGRTGPARTGRRTGPGLAPGLAVVMVVAGSLAVEPTDAVLITPVIVGLVTLVADRAVPRLLGPGLALVAAVVTAVGSALGGRSPEFVLGVLAGIVLGIVLGVTRRQAAEAEAQRVELLHRGVEIEREQQRNALLADRARAARDIHDVLAHSLGGLVVQLDAVEALLEADRIDEATGRVGRARALAADGLAEARRAVSALREPTTSASASESTASTGVAGLLADHVELGGTVVADGVELVAALPAPHRAVATALVREALSNVRRHAPGETATIVVTPGRLLVSNPLAAAVSDSATDVGARAAAAPGAGHGLVGMCERVAALDDGSRIETRPRDGLFVVEVSWGSAT
ncbi:sensor histidine kinase [Frigoribacterium sp. 2-23]|uniref:sensor histidine kinase n=1 Tax=Frigoribacterium sp. 2-23 TaxID=3415006 RepID=UPI003C6EF495